MTTTMASSSSSPVAGLGDMFVPPSSNTNAQQQRVLESHSDTEVELDHAKEEEGASSSSSPRPGSSPKQRHHHASRSLSGEVIVVGTPAVAAQTVARPLTWTPPEEPHRAVHRIRLAALEHNYHQVEAAASRQLCSVITVVKADGYGHGAIATALHLADACGADAFAVATLEEGIALRKAFAANPPGQWSKQLAAHFHTQHGVHNDHASSDIMTPPAASHQGATTTTTTSSLQNVTHRRPAQIRIVVLGPPVGFPRCFDDYYHHNIEVMVSGPEVAASLMHWVADDAQRKRTAVERAAKEAKFAALYSYSKDRNDGVVVMTTTSTNPAAAVPIAAQTSTTKKVSAEASTSTASSTAGSWGTNGSPTPEETAATMAQTKKTLPHPASTLGNVQGIELAREVRSLMLHQQEAKMILHHQLHHQQQQNQQQQHSNVGSAAPSVDDAASSDQSSSGGSPRLTKHKTLEETNTVATSIDTTTLPSTCSTKPEITTLFGGIEAAARSSRHNEAAAARARAVLQEENDDDDDNDNHDLTSDSPVTSIAIPAATPAPVIRKRLRWHALVDSGMGRLGFKTEIVSAHDKTGRRDTVAVLKEMIDLELEGNAPLEFFGMCTHMADARDLSDYTNSQMGRFKALLKRVRAAGIEVPTVSTDNSAALLTTSLQHFDPVEMLSQAGADTRGYVRTGGAIYGQRPSFPQLKAVSTLLASVRHVAILKKGDTVGYDRAYVAPHDVRIATLTIGFADGYPRELGNGVGKVQIRGAVFPVAGNVCMDMLMVDLGPANEKTGIGASVVVGDTAVLWGPLDEDVENGADNQGMVRLQDIAATLKTTQSALTCGLDKMRVRRHFI